LPVALAVLSILAPAVNACTDAQSGTPQPGTAVPTASGVSSACASIGSRSSTP